MSAPSGPAPSPGGGGPAAPELLRGLRRIDVIALTVNVVVGAGVFAMPGALTLHAGRYGLLVLVGAFVVVALLALALVEVASRYDITGGPQVYAQAAFGPQAGFMVGWMLALSRIAVFGAIAKVMLDYGAELWAPLADWWPRALVASVFMGLLVAFNLRGVTRGAWVGNLLTAAKVLPLLPIALAGLWYLDQAALPETVPEQVSDLTRAMLVALFACFGFEQAAVVTGEMQRPKRDLAVSVLGGLGIACALYLLLLLACYALVPDLTASRLPLVDVAIALFGPAGGPAMALAAVLSSAGGLAGAMLVAPRIFFALGESGDLPRVLAAVHPRTRAPHVAIWIMGIGAWLMTITGTFIYLVTVFVIARIAAYASTAAALIVLRRRDGPAPVPVPGGPVIAVAALVCCAAIVATSSLTAVRDVAIALAAGFMVRALVRWRR